MVLWKVGGSALIVTLTHTDCPEGMGGSGTDTLSATWQQIKDAYDAGLPVYLQYETPEYGYVRIYLEGLRVENSYYIATFQGADYSASTANDYLGYENCVSFG